MKLIKYIVLSGFAGLILWSCTEEKLGPVLQNTGGLALTSPAAGTNWVLIDTAAEENLPAFTWTAVNYGFDAGPSYRLEMDVAGRNFSAPATLANVNALSALVTQGDVNNVLLTKELQEEVPAQIDFRVIATVNPDVPGDTSETVTITITPYKSNVVIPQLQVPGSYQNWMPIDSTTAIYAPTTPGQYEGYIYFNIDNAEYKYTVGPDWTTNYGDNGSDGTLDAGGGNIFAGAAGVYKLNANLNQLTHTQLRTDWGLIGSATPSGWDADQDMTYDEANRKFTITVDLIPGAIKFRANDDWAVNFGDDGNNLVLEYGGADILITEAGNYTIDLFIVGVPKYRYGITKN